ncbi:MAG: hypothetical protein AAGG01_16785 [Planctomycetota bacterium]
MRSSGSLQRWISLAALLAVGLSLGAGGYVVDRSVRQRTVSEARSSLGALLRVSSTRIVNESRRAVRESDGIIDSETFVTKGALSWLVLAPPDDMDVRQLPRRSDGSTIGPGEELARSEAFPLPSAPLVGALNDEAAPEIQFLEVDGADGLPYRIGTMMVTPALDMPPRDREGRDRSQRDFFRDRPRDGPRGDDDRPRDRRPPRSRRDGDFRDEGGGRWARGDRRPDLGPGAPFKLTAPSLAQVA